MREEGLRALAGVTEEGNLAEAVRRLGAGPFDDVAREWFDKLEGRRSELLKSTAPIWVNSMGASGETMTVGEVCERASKQPHWAAFLYELVRLEEPRVVFEMGTSVGISGCYLAAGLAANGRGRLVTLEGRSDVAEVAARGFKELALPAEIVVGRFDDTFEPALRAAAAVDLIFIDGNHHEEPTVRYFTQALEWLSPHALVVFDDIGWSPGMKRAWATVSRHRAVRTAVDMHEVGVVRLKEKRRNQ